MDKKLIKEKLATLREANVSGERVTKRAQKVSGDENKAYYKDVEKKMKDYGKELDQEDENKIDPVKSNYENSDKEFHDEMEIRNGQEMIQYDREPSQMFKDRAKKAIEGDSTMGNKTYTGKENGNTEPVWGASDADFGKKLVNTVQDSKKKRDDATGTFNQFGDDIEMSPKAPKIIKKQVAVESMKRIKFKKPFDGVGNALKLIPEAFKVNEKVFELTDGNEKYKVKWVGSLTEGKAVVLEASDKKLMSESFNKIKHLMNYKSEDTLGTLSGQDRINENNFIKAGMTQGFANEAEDENNSITESDPKDSEEKHWEDMATWNERFSGDDEDSGDYDD